MRFLVFAAAAALMACTPGHHHPDPGAAHSAAPARGETEAQAMRVSGEWIEATQAQAKASISFAAGAASGSTGCNRWTASVDQANGLRFGVGAVTEMACPGPAMAAERRFLDALNATRGAGHGGGRLTLADGSGAELGRVVRPAGALGGRGLAARGR